MEKAKRRIGIMGGTFDPVHLGHLILAEKAYEQFGLDQVLFIPSGNPPHKQHREGRASDAERVEMVRRAIEDNPHFSLSEIEMEEDGYSYTYRTLERLKARHPDTEYYFIIGADSLYDFDDWMEPQRILDSCILTVATRNNTPVSELNKRIDEIRGRYHGTVMLLNTRNIDISSSMLREWVSKGYSLRYYIPESVIHYMNENGIYRKDRFRFDE